MASFSLHEVLGVARERAEAISAELHDVLHDSDSMPAASQKLSETYDPDSLLMGAFLGLAIMMNDKRVVPQGYSIEMNAVPNDPPERPAEDSPEHPAEDFPDPPERWVCPECGAIVEEIIYVTLPRTMVQGEHGEHTEVTCPVCNRPTIGMLWRVAEVVGTGELE